MTLAPLRVPPDLRLTPEQFAKLCAENREAVLELTADGSVIVMTPTGGETGARNSRLEMRLLLWADQQGAWKVFVSSTGFRLPDGSVLNPDACLVRLDRWQPSIHEYRGSFSSICLDLFVELESTSGERPRALNSLRSKMATNSLMVPALCSGRLRINTSLCQLPPLTKRRVYCIGVRIGVSDTFP